MAILRTHSRWARGATVLITAATVPVTACSSAHPQSSVEPSTSSASATSGTSPAKPFGPLKSGGPVQFTAYSSTDGPDSVAVLTGAIADFGHGQRTKTDTDPQAEYSQMVLRLANGTFALSIATLEHDLVRGFSHFPSNSRTCSGMVTVTDATPIVSGSGSGAYEGIRGTLTTTVTVNEVDAPPNCNGLLSQTIFLSGSGTVGFG